MGNAWFGKKRSTKAVVHPEVVRGVTTIKVRMTKAQLMDLTQKVDMTNNYGNSELGRLIVQECSKGRFHARVVVVAAAAASAGHDSQRAHMFSRERGLTPIQENSDE
ncbi:hypothetical protein AAZX31_03G239700 [Glycine max]|uniref:Uncharacterized protein n=2 Tax=Glycine subgen. Soja TaxID=1462606 RepID=K7KH55_SOYBN|nr:hypothetical protein JHK87_008439 [Glycine soja]KAG5056316.1 hypothetical protein JHK85_008826 [Glycine max]KAG5073380.1 hypothetical protein JHK86_008591 [Glycine max]KAH1071906.1 hypothetical protein GYH30_008413 [Glycine max]KAH1259614.1 hypothetical protein GmHk_03G009036 [Glycine max]